VNSGGAHVTNEATTAARKSVFATASGRRLCGERVEPQNNVQANKEREEVSEQKRKFYTNDRVQATTTGNNGNAKTQTNVNL